MARSKRKTTRKTSRKRRSSFWRKKRKLFLWLVVLLAAVLLAVVYVRRHNSLRVDGLYAGVTQYDGIDVSKHNGKINWKTVARNRNIKFVYIKATEGSSIVDSRYRRNLQQARAAGLKVGSYHFFRGYKSAREQFALFSKHVKKGEQDLLPMVDVEQAGNSRLTRQRLQKELREFMELCKKHYGRYPLLYSQYRFYNEKLAPEFNRHLIFIARYGKTKPVLRGGGKYNIWQFSEKGRINGIEGYVDLDRFANGTKLRDISF